MLPNVLIIGAEKTATTWLARCRRGEYFTHVARYLQVFPRDRLPVPLYDLVQEDSAREPRRCLEFLGVDPDFRPSTLQLRLNEGGVDITTATGPVRKIRSAMRSGVLWRAAGSRPRSAAPASDAVLAGRPRPT